MIFVGYLLLVAAVVWIVVKGLSWRLPTKLEVPARALGVVLDAAFLALGLALLAGGSPGVAGVVLLMALTLGAGVYLWGITLWRGRGAQVLRVVGWSVMAGALVVPTTISLTLPLLALLAPTLAAPAD